MDLITLDAFMAQLGEAGSGAGPKIVAHDMMQVAELVAKRAKNQFGLSVDDAQFVLKASVPEIQNIGTADATGDDRFVKSLITTIAKDRQGEVVLPEGVILDDYLIHPIVLYGHQYGELGMGRNAWIHPNVEAPVERMHGILAKTIYVSAKANPFAEQIYQWRVEKMPMGESIGFIPVEWTTPDDKLFSGIHDKWVKRVTAFLMTKGREVTEDLLEGIKRIYTKWIQLEYSNVMMPANAFAVSRAVEKGMLEESQVEAYTIKEGGMKRQEAIRGLDHNENKNHQRFKMDYTVPENRELWNKSLEMDFDISEFDEAELDFDNAVYTKFLQCAVKNIYVNKYHIPSPLIGTYLSSIEAVTSVLTVKDTRRFSSSGKESPPRRSNIQLNSTKSGRFLVDGTEFSHTEHGVPVIKDFYQSWGGIVFSLIVSDEYESVSNELMQAIHLHADSNHMLKGEKFALSGEFLSKTDDTWDALIIDAKDKLAIQKSLDITTDHGKSRGLIFAGPPGTGKTLAGRTLMNDTDNTFIWMSARDFMYGWPSSIISLAFDMARKLSPTVLFMEDIDSNLDVDLIKTELDGLRQNSGLMTVLTTNFPQRLPEALIDRPGRFHHVLHFALPTDVQREQMIKRWAGDIDKATLDTITEYTDGFSGAHIKHLIDYAFQISDDEGMAIERALIESLINMGEQRELISELRATEQKGLFSENELRESARVASENDNEEITPEMARAILSMVEEREFEGVTLDLNDFTPEELKRYSRGGIA